jgi:hypothetical protein
MPAGHYWDLGGFKIFMKMEFMANTIGAGGSAYAIL